MSITAARLGSSPLLLDWSNLMRPARSIAGSGQASVQFQAAWDKMKTRFAATADGKREVGFYDAVTTPAVSQIEESLALARKIRESQKFTDVLCLGIGGSSLGPISLLHALKHQADGKLKIQFLENPDAIEWTTTIAQLNPATTLVVCITKSGTTFETMAQYLLALEWLTSDRWSTHSVAITDPQKGDLRKFATENHIPTLSIDSSIGGRFSLFSPVGLFPAALAGLNPHALLEGASQVKSYIEKTAPEKNALFQIGADLIAHYEKRPIHVCMPYSTALKSVGSWFVQLWAESLGKDLKGFTPIAALGAVDQHSILQLLRDGPDDKVTLFLTVGSTEPKVTIPHLSRLKTIKPGATPPAFQILEGHTLQELLQIEYQAISLVMTRRSRPHLSLQIEKLDERSLGALYYAFCVLTAFTGSLWNVNPFDQPGVEEGKVYIQQSLNQRAMEHRNNPDSDDNSPVARLRTYANRSREDGEDGI